MASWWEPAAGFRQLNDHLRLQCQGMAQHAGSSMPELTVDEVPEKRECLSDGWNRVSPSVDL
jgi:hypothetical protein